ncbi:hypothetical protein PV10_04237 [Exophiala mesophila]|uniref:Riboflavin kinase n=1 Tax=Exophiala mesophila TaxID=212818 RepID=A0A0D2A1T9_EXOME|nr:uncharacterized protein PV10_04237 [Exophiala mesophila]KIV92988.1 hypothetical protein PV10_04237 [Exophiala mesophila]
MPEKRPDTPRELFAGPESGPETPFPIKLQGPIIKGFGRGSRELGIPTANIPPEGLSTYPNLESGVYYGFVGLSLPSSVEGTPSSSTPSTPTPSSSTTTTTSVPLSTPQQPSKIYPCVLSIGYNPFYHNKTRSVEIHILQSFKHDFYGAGLNLLMLGFIRPEYDYDSLEALVDDIHFDCEVARRSLLRESYLAAKKEYHSWLEDFEWVNKVDAVEVERAVLNKAS